MSELSKYLRWIADFAIGIILIGLTINSTSNLMNRPQSETLARWGWFAILLYATGHTLLVPQVRNFVFRMLNTKRKGAVLPYLLASVIGAILAPLYLFIADAIVEKLKAAESPDEQKAALVLEDVVRDPFPGNSELNISFKLRNDGNADATEMYYAYHLHVKPGLSEDALRDGMEAFMVQWPALRRAQRQLQGPFSIPAKEFIRLPDIRQAITAEKYKDIHEKRIFVVVIGAVRYRDTTGIHELRICRYLQPPFDHMTWILDSRYDSKISDIVQAQIPIQIAFDPVGVLPLHVPPVSNVSLLTFTQRKEARITWSKGGSVTIPITAPHVSIHGEQIVIAIKITNHGTVPVLNLNSTLQFEFREGAETNTAEKINKIIEGENLGTRRLPLSIEALGPGSEATLFIVNQSQYSIIVHPLLAGTLELQGEMMK